MVFTCHYTAMGERRRGNVFAIDFFGEKEKKEVTAKKRRGKPSGETLRARVSEIRHRANFPKVERWLRLRRAHGQSASWLNFSTANRVPPASWELPPRASTTTTRFFICSPLLVFSRWRSAKTSCPVALLCFALLDSALKHFHLSITRIARRLRNGKAAASDFRSNRSWWSIECG